MAAPATHKLTMPGAMLQRGFWLYVWRVTDAGGEEYLYVGRTGDNSSPNAAAPYTRMGQHLGTIKNQNALRKHLTKQKVDLESCTYDLIAHGPIHAEVERPDGHEERKARRAELFELHRPFRDCVGAYERDLANALKDAGYTVLNTVTWKHHGDQAQSLDIIRAFAKHFPRLARNE